MIEAAVVFRDDRLRRLDGRHAVYAAADRFDPRMSRRIRTAKYLLDSAPGCVPGDDGKSAARVAAAALRAWQGGVLVEIGIGHAGIGLSGVRRSHRRLVLAAGGAIKDFHLRARAGRLAVLLVSLEVAHGGLLRHREEVAVATPDAHCGVGIRQRGEPRIVLVVDDAAHPRVDLLPLHLAERHTGNLLPLRLGARRGDALCAVATEQGFDQTAVVAAAAKTLDRLLGR